MKRLFTIVLFSLFVVSAYAQNNEVAIVYSGKSAVNRETGKYIIKQAKNKSLDYNFKVIDVSKLEDSSAYKAVIILNTGVASPQLSSGVQNFVTNNANNGNLILLTFIKGSKGLEPKLLTGENAIGGVDGISSASIYKGQQNTNFEWFDMLVELLK